MQNIYGVVSSGPNDSDSLSVKTLTKIVAEVRVEAVELAGKFVYIAYNETEITVTPPPSRSHSLETVIDECMMIAQSTQATLLLQM